MRRLSGRALLLALLTLSIPSAVSADGEKILVFKDSIPYSGHAAGIAAGLALIREFATTHAFTVDTTVHLTTFNDSDLAPYDAVVFLYPEPYSPTNPAVGLSDTMSEEEAAAFKRFILTGKGVLGVHTHSRLNANWEWYVQEFMGMKYVNDIGPQSSTYHVADTNEFLTLGIPKTFTDNQQVRVDSLYFTEADTSYKVLIRADEKDYPANQKMDFYPYVYRHNYEGARFFGLAPGHNASTWDPGSHWNTLLLNGLLYAVNRPGYGTPTAVAREAASTHPGPTIEARAVHYTLPRRAHVAIQVFDLEGRMVATLVDRTVDAGAYSVPLPDNLRNAVYLLDVKTGDVHTSMKLAR